jgi:hypothetical protein
MIVPLIQGEGILRSYASKKFEKKVPDAPRIML